MSVETATFLRPCEKAALASAGLTSMEHVVNAIPAHLARILPPPPLLQAPNTLNVEVPTPPSTSSNTQQQHQRLSTSATSTTGTVTVSPDQIEYAIKVADRCLAALQLQANWFSGDTTTTNKKTSCFSGADAAEEGDVASRDADDGVTSSSILVPSNDSWADIDCTPIAIAEEIDESILSASTGKKKNITHLSSNTAAETVGAACAESPPSLRQRLVASCDWLRQASIDAYLPPPPKVLSLDKILNEENQCAVSKIATFARDLDAMLGGGVPLGCVTEICGAPGMGKTQMGMQLAVSAQLPTSFGGLGGRCLYLDTEGSFIPSRYREIASGAVSQVQKIANLQRQQSRDAPSLSSNDRRSIDEFSVTNILDRTRYIRVLQLVDLIAIVNGLPALVQSVNNDVNNNSTTPTSSLLPPIRLIVIDSIAFHFRYAMGSDFSSRARTVHTLGQTLQQHARSLGIAIVVTNQMNPAGANQQISPSGGGDEQTSHNNNNNNGNIPPTYPNVLGVNNYGDRLVPALGDSWAQTVSSRVLLRGLSDMERRHVIGILTNQHQLTTTSNNNNGNNNSSSTAGAQHRHFVESLQQQVNELRVALLLKSSSQSRAQCFFRITERGIRNPAPDLLDAIVAGGAGGGGGR